MFFCCRLSYACLSCHLCCASCNLGDLGIAFDPVAALKLYFSPSLVCPTFDHLIRMSRRLQEGYSITMDAAKIAGVAGPEDPSLGLFECCDEGANSPLCTLILCPVCVAPCYFATNGVYVSPYFIVNKAIISMLVLTFRHVFFTDWLMAQRKLQIGASTASHMLLHQPCVSDG